MTEAEKLMVKSLQLELRLADVELRMERKRNRALTALAKDAISAFDGLYKTAEEVHRQLYENYCAHGRFTLQNNHGRTKVGPKSHEKLTSVVFDSFSNLAQHMGEPTPPQSLKEALDELKKPA